MTLPNGGRAQSRAPNKFIYQTRLLVLPVVALFLVIAAFMFTEPAKSQGGVMIITPCVTLEDVKNIPGTAWEAQTIYDGAEVQRIVRAYNDAPPKSRNEADRVMLATRTAPPGEYAHGIVFELEGCVEARVFLTERLYNRITEQAFGQAL